jgi:hypothetical protein
LATFGSLSPGSVELAEVVGFFALGVDFFAACFGLCFGAGFAASVAGFPACPAVFTLIFGGAGLFPEAAGLLAAGAAGLFWAAGAETAVLFCAAEAGTGFVGVCAAGLSPGFALCGADFPAARVAGVAPVPLAGFVCACRLQQAAASVIPTTRVFTKRIFRSFPFRVSPPVSPHLSNLLRRHSAW